MTLIPDAYQIFSRICRDTSTLGGIMEMLSWDQQVNCPEEGREHRQEQGALLARLLHRKFKSADYSHAIQELFDLGPDPFTPAQWVNIRLAHKKWGENQKIPENMIDEGARLAGKGFDSWLRAKKKQDFSLFEPVLEKWVSFRTRMAGILYPEKHPYDVLLDQFEEGLSRAEVDRVFVPLRGGLVKILNRIQESGSPIIEPSFELPIPSQMEISRQVCEGIGFDFTRGCLHSSPHPFTGGSHPTDVRITTRYNQENFLSSISSCVHEVGHGLYEQGRPLGELDRLPAGMALGMVMHESQSLLYERRVGQGLPFWEFYLPQWQEKYPGFLNGFSAKDFYRVVNRVKPGFIRTEADEVTYPMHIILRYEIERLLFSDKNPIKVSDVPELWREKSKELLGIVPEKDSQGPLQDVHWSDGAFGYFPDYTLGAMYGAQIYQTALDENLGLEKEFAVGNFTTLRNWLRDNIHSQGRLLTAPERLKKVTGKNLEAEDYLTYLKTKYGEIYSINRWV